MCIRDSHNPLGAWMVVVLLSLGAGAAVTGALYLTDRFWGEAWLIAAHALLAWPLCLLIPLHLAGVIHASRRHRENLVGAMWWHGCKLDESWDSALSCPVGRRDQPSAHE